MYILPTSVFELTNTPHGRAVVYGARAGFPSPSDCVWIIPGTENAFTARAAQLHNTAATSQIDNGGLERETRSAPMPATSAGIARTDERRDAFNR